MLSCVIDAKERRHVATADIPGAFMQADMDEVVYMRLEGVMGDLEYGNKFSRIFNYDVY